MPPLIRRRPLVERIKAQLDPYDFLLWLSEELNDDTYDDVLNAWATPIGLALNLVFILARGASRRSSGGIDDVFGDTAAAGRGWFSWLSAFLVHSLTLLCCLNAFYTFFRKKHYRLFEQPVDIAPSTPAARRVRVEDSPSTNSPLQYVREVIANATRAQRRPDAEKEVWEVAVWDAKPFNLTFFTLFSPGHLLVYYALLPATPLDPRPSVTVLLAVVFGVVLSLQLGYMRTCFDRQRKDKALIQGEVLNEYNTKFVHPSLNRLMRDVATQTRETALSPKGTRTREVDVYTPTVIINRGFSTNPNPNYSALYSPQAQTPNIEHDRRSSGHAGRSIEESPATRGARRSSGYMQTPTIRPSEATPYNYSSPLKPNDDIPERRSLANGGDGYLGVYSHAASPLRKSTSNQTLQRAGEGRSTAHLGTGTAYDGVRSSRQRKDTGHF